MNKLLRSIVTYSYIIGYIPTQLNTLKKLRKRKAELTTAEYDQAVFETPQRWSQNILKKAGATAHLTGTENLQQGPVLFVANHEGNFDIPVLIATVPKPFGFLSKVEVKKIPFIADWMDELNCVFIDRSNRRSALNSISDSVESLKAGHSLLLFPEGARSKGNEMKEFKTGFVRIAAKAQVPIIPIAIVGTSRLMEQNDNKITPAEVFVKILPAVYQQQDESTDTFKERVERLIQDARSDLQGESR